MRDFCIEERFKCLLPELTSEERSALRKSIEKDGCQSPLVVWDKSPTALRSLGLGVCKDESCANLQKQLPASRWEPGDGRWECPECGWGIAPMEEDVLVDGHNRLEICEELGVPFKVVKRFFEDESEAMDWIDANQIARRNLTPDAFRLALGRRYNRMKKAVPNPHGIGGKSGKIVEGQFDTQQSTAARLASEHGTSEATVKRAGKFAEEVAADPDLQNAIRERKPVAKVKKQKNIQVRQERVIQESKKAANGSAVIRLGNCKEVLSDVGAIDLLIADPPYFTDGDFTEYVSEFLSRVKPSGQAYVFAGADPDEVAAYLSMNRRGMILEQMLIWNYNNTGQRQPLARYNSNFQVVFYFRGKDACHINRPSDGTHQYACQTVNAPDGRMGDRFHEWQKPQGLIERYILNSSKPGDLVCDPFAGTGTTLIAAAKHGRIAIGCDVDEGAVAIAVKRGCIPNAL